LFRPRAWALVISSLAVVIALAVAVYLYSPAIGTPSPTALDYSVSREVGAGMSWIHACQRRSSQTWRCEVWDSEFSNTAMYVVTMDGGRCWRARSVDGSAEFAEGGPLKDPASGCVSLRDQLRFDSRIF
jgi:hypothetical protein